MESFWQACEARGPLILEVEEFEGARPIRYAFDRPSILIGSGPRSDLRIDHPDVSRRHAYLQMIAGHPFLVDLDSRTGIRMGGGKAAGGWVVPGHPVRIGTSRVWFRTGTDEEDVGTTIGSNPLFSKDRRATSHPSTTLLVVDGPDARSIPISRTLTLIGRSPRCKIRLSSSLASNFQGALLRTPLGVWVVDLQASDGVSVNGTRMNHARLEDGDELRLGPLVARLSDQRSSASLARPPQAGASLAVVRPATSESGLAGIDLQTILDQVAGNQDQPGDQFGRMILLLTQMMGTMHREMVDLVREELEQIRRLATEMQALRTDPPGGIQGRLAAPPTTTARAESGTPRPQSPNSVAPPHPRDPNDVHLIVAERLEAFERERQGHWNRVFRILFKAEH